MKKLIAVLSALIIAMSLASCSSGPADKSDPGTDAGTTVSDTTEKAGETTAKENADEDAIIEEETDAKGNIKEQKKTDKNGNLLEKTENTYAGDGTLKSSTVTSYDGDRVSKELMTFYSSDKKDSRVVERTYTYNKDGTVVVSTLENGEKVLENVKDADGNLISSTTYNKSGSAKNIYKNGEIVKTESYGSDEKLIGYSEMKFDENGKATGSETFSAEGKPLSKTVYEYDGDKVSQIKIYSADGNLARIGKYDSTGKLYMYDANGNPVK